MQPQIQPQSGAGNGLDPDVINLAKAIRQTESGGNYFASGRSGEFGAYQYTPGTWQKYATEAGIDTPLEQSTAEQQNEVTYKKIKQWKDQGLNVGQIASMWNSGKPDAYLDETYKGTNKEGAKFDVPAYAKSVAIAYQTLKQGGQVQADPNNPSSVGGFVNPASTQQPSTNFVNPPQVQSDTTPIPETPTPGLMSRLIHGAGDVFKSIESPFLGVAATPVQLLAKATGHADPFANKAFGGVEATNLEGGALKATEKKLGDVAQVGSYLIPGEGALGAIGTGVAQGAGNAMSKGEGLIPTLVSGGAGGLVGLGTFGLAKGIGSLLEAGAGENALRGSASKEFEDILKPTTKPNKLLTQKIAPELAERQILAPSQEALLEKGLQEQQIAGEKLGEAWDTLPDDAKFEISNIFKKLNDKMEEFRVNGVVPDAVKSDFNALQSVQRDLLNIGTEVGPDGNAVFADARNLRKLRQIMDFGKKTFAVSDLDAAKKQAQNTLANLIRTELSDQAPSIAKLNKDYTFWSNVVDVMDATLTRQKGQSGIIRKLGREAVGAVAGSTAGHPIIGAGIFRALGEVIDSAAWKTTSAMIKTKLANALSKANYAESTNIIAKLMQKAGQAAENPITPKIISGGLIPNLLNR